jgi:hypothetical protein
MISFVQFGLINKLLSNFGHDFSDVGLEEVIYDQLIGK